MNTEIYRKISNFLDSVGSYVYMEYGSDYYNEFTKDKNLQRMYDFVGSYYLGGNNVPDTARYVVELLNMIKDGRA
jgi:hypothetical protein